MKIIFDHQVFCTQRYGGFTKYFYLLARNLNALVGTQAKVIAPAHINGYLDASVLGRGSFALHALARGLNHRVRLAAPLFKLAAAAQKPDVVHETHYILDGSHVPAGSAKVATCHDMIEEKGLFPHANLEAGIRLKRQSYERADAIICISKNTYNDLLDAYPHLAPRTHVVYHGVEKTKPVPPATIKLPAAFILYVGVRGGYKNFANLIQAFALSPRLRDDFDLVCFGGGEFSKAELQALDGAGVDPRRVHVMTGNDGFLAHVYASAAALVYPSRYEGFGMPITEAMAQGCPVLASRTSSLPEVGGDAAAYFNPFQAEDMVAAIEQVVFSSTRRHQMSESGRARASTFTWDACANATLSAYNQARMQRGLHA